MSTEVRRAPLLLREYADLNRRRKGEGLTPHDYLRWLDLRQQLERLFPDRAAPGGGGPVRMRIEYATLRQLEESAMWNVRPVGLFVSTAFAADEGTPLELVVVVVETGEEYRTRVVVVSNNVGPDFSTAELGMGLRFLAGGSALATRLEQLRKPPPRS